jgi:D-alanyl-D-alanine carboxypeptidase
MIGKGGGVRAGVLARSISLVFVLLFLGGLGAPASARYGAIVVDADSGHVLFADRAEDTNFPASLTKMMTLYLTFEALEEGRLRLDSRLPVSHHAESRAPTKLNLVAGQSIAVKDAILGLVTKSANDAASVLAEALGGSEQRFSDMMTAKAHSLGMPRTVFRNASGLPDRLQVSTAKDLAVLARALIKRFPQYYSYFGTREFTFRGDVYTNHNRLVGTYPGADGLKTGFTVASGFNLAASAVQNGRRLIVVVMGGHTARERDLQVIDLFDQAFSAVARGENLIAPATTRVAALPPPPARAKAKAEAPARSKPLAKPKKPAESPAVVQGSTAETLANSGANSGANAARDERSGWAVQVGAYAGQAQAKQAAARAARQLPRHLGKAKIVVESVRTTEGLLHRARLVGLSEKDARSACVELAKRKTPCIAMPLTTS